MNVIDKINSGQLKKKIPDFRPGDTVAVHTKVREGDKERIQIFEGVVIRRRKGKINASFTVRKVSYGVGVERVFPLHSSMIDRMEIVTRGKVSRSRLYYLRQLTGKAARIKEKAYEEVAEVAGEEPETKEGEAATPAPPSES